MLRLSLLLIFVIFCLNIYGQNEGRAIIKNFDSKNYKASNSNFSITQDSKGIIYSANLEGLLSYNGSTWKLNSPNSRFISSIFYSKNTSLLFYGEKNDFGIIISDAQGLLVKKSLLGEYTLSNKPFIVWHIIETSPSCIFFLTTAGLFRWMNEEITHFNGDYSNQFFQVENTIYIPDNENGISEIQGCSPKSIEGALKLKEYEIKLISGKKDSLVVIASSDSSFLLKKNRLLSFKNIDELDTDNIRFGTTLKNGDNAFGNTKNGVQVLSNNDINNYNKSIGLKGQFVKFIFEDNESNLWLAMQEGISIIKHKNGFMQFNENNGLYGSSWAISTDQNNMLVGTTSSLFLISYGNIIDFKEIDEHVWTIKRIDDKIYFGTRSGLYSISSNNELPEKILIDRGISFLEILNDSTYLVTSLEGLNLYAKEGINNLRKLTSIKIPSNTYNSALVDRNNNVWVSSKFNGVYRWDVINKKVKLYNSNNGIDDTYFTKLVLINNQLHVFTTDGLYQYNDSVDRFEKLFQYHKKIQYVFKYSDGSYIISAKDSFDDTTLDLVKLKNAGYKILSTKFNGFDYSEIRNIEKDKDGNLWFATPEGLFKYTSDSNFTHNLNYNTLVNKVSILDSTIFFGHYTDSLNTLPRFVVDQPDSYKPRLEYSQNALKFEYGATYFTQNDKIKFKYFLQGNDEVWSSWTKERVKEYNNLSPGEYAFHVKSTNVFDVEGRTASYSFTILPPWYMTTWAYTLFTLGGLGLVWFIVLAYSYRIRQQRKKLKLIVADRTFEVLSQKKEIEKQNDTLKDQNEEISKQRDAINEKNQELEMSQEEILSINDRLQELNLSLEKKVEDRTSKIKTTVKQLQKTIAELDTFIYRASHDLKGPISRINGLASLAKLETTNPNDIKYYDLIDLVAKDMSKLLAKLTQVHEVINCDATKESIDLPSLIADIKNRIQFLDSGHPSKYSFGLEGNLQIDSDSFLVDVIFTNLMENALIFKKPYQDDHEIKVKASGDKTHYYIEIEDNGIGIREAHISNIFDMFYRGSDQSKGNGLGLYLTKMAVDKLHGKIEVQSEFEKFTRFTISLPK